MSSSQVTEHITWQSVQCYLGQVLVACSDTGVCALMAGESLPPLMERLRSRFPRAQLCQAENACPSWLGKVKAQLTDGRSAEPLALDLRGTEFQQQVWQALQSIPSGEVISYAELARRAGRPKAVRAAASACGANPVAVLVPCHRVLRSNGDLGGYNGGVAIKKALLAHEQTLSAR
ncbi:AraC family transcriptional regulator of adaptative response/methylated-DNA-[protein]-cysteine methyltransferase [Marinobacter sp. LV10R520-4]|uniref:methylated-DNA--[protein]-cysteine S-methyltransferase n=1 Tax=Marinobacter sp. LV10R520-4 TaxID=1761796 RepID=UPI000BF683D6|nr:methylated-DNA--[protein]-cysteine S-methyltransferase [Marinobacter sp. LV10R520-4]PFG55000.1 AraC family transcriptional regulator of adaptative response/methylated-DNA-[protein]-cysteine methyltransferase [Marinobacter sp. LV10R520-4]